MHSIGRVNLTAEGDVASNWLNAHVALEYVLGLDTGETFQKRFFKEAYVTHLLRTGP